MLQLQKKKKKTRVCMCVSNQLRELRHKEKESHFMDNNTQQVGIINTQ